MWNISMPCLMPKRPHLRARKRPKWQNSFINPLSMAARGGFTQDAALANERCGEFILSVLSDKDEGRYYLEQAIKFYSDWGATKKVEMLQDEYKDVLRK
jgi:hypothetical protein